MANIAALLLVDRLAGPDDDATAARFLEAAGSQPS